MMSEETVKNPKRVAAGKKGAEAKKLKKLEITKDDDEVLQTKINVYKNYIPLCISIGVVGLGFYFFTRKKVVVEKVKVKEENQSVKTKYDPFEFN